jgi:uncharacterized membrane protein
MEKKSNDLSVLLNINEIGELERQTLDRLSFYSSKLSAESDLLPYERDALHSQIKRDTVHIKKWRFRMRQTLNKLGDPIDEVETTLRELEALERRPLRMLKALPNSLIDCEERKSRHFTQGITFYKLFWVFFLGCFTGVVVETLWCFIQYGRIENRAGLVWGPFNPVYGLGAFVLTLALYKYRNRSKLYSFIGGMLAGSAVEYLCSLLQETIFGATSWDYSANPLNLNGRICLQYSIIWGLLGVLWIKSLYPRMVQLILKIPNKHGKALTWVMFAFICVNILVSAAAVYRWSERDAGIPASNAIERLLDDRFSDERMKSIYPTLEFGKIGD